MSATGETNVPGSRGFDRTPRLSYQSYLKVPELLQLQDLLASPPREDELQFIVVHQTYELWFRLVLVTLESVRGAMLAGRLDDAEDGLRRVHAIERVLAQQIHVLETMTPASFLGFRDHLRPASGFQSVQFREIEVLSGLRDAPFLESLRKEDVPEVHEALGRRLAEMSLREAMHAMLAASGLDVGWSDAARTVDEARLDAALLSIYRTHAPRDVYRVLEALIEHDELFRLWRVHHVTMVERIIGSMPGTGGSSGAAYLRSTTAHRFYPELWRVRGALGAP